MFAWLLVSLVSSVLLWSVLDSRGKIEFLKNENARISLQLIEESSRRNRCEEEKKRRYSDFDIFKERLTTFLQEEGVET